MRGAFISAILILVSMIIGAGMFGLPFAFAEAGFWIGTCILIVVTAMMIVLHLAYAEIVRLTPGSHRLPGYAEMYLGSIPGTCAKISALLGVGGTLIAYLILGSVFLQNIFHAGGITISSASAVALLAGFSCCVSAFPLQRETRINSALSLFLLIFLIIFVALLLPHIEARHLESIDLKSALSPYGILVFALSGANVIPELVILLKRNKNLIRQAIIVGTLLPASLYFLFTLGVVGAVGRGTSKDAISSLALVWGGGAVWWGSVIGLLAVLTSHILLTDYFQAVFRFDFHIPKTRAWWFGIVLPVGGYFLGLRDFIRIIGVTGAFMLGFEALLLIGILHRMQRQRHTTLSWRSYMWKIAMVGMIWIGAGYEILRIINFL
ncbi:MAG: aromatic amino acid permease [Parcubacteria group bacterium Gr01-1014_66]|nr:MAG: aromatic amino acid permease [Parcubacteria group bacterium Gr01-1014_66]